MSFNSDFIETEFGKIPQGWKVVNLEEQLEALIDYRGKTPRKSDDGIVALSAKSVKMGFIDYSRTYHVSKETYNKFMVRGFPEVGDVLVTTEAPLGCVARLDRDDVCIAQRLLTLRGKANVLDNDYLRYFLTSKVGQHELISRQTGSTVQGIKRSEFKKVRIVLPDIVSQKKISKILNDLDMKIENNRRMNETLEAMARAIFKSWFVDFDPVHAKAAGNTPAHMDAETAALFPATFGDDGLPMGWNLYSLGEVTEKITKGTTPSNKDLNDAKTELSTINFLKVNTISDDGYFNQKSFDKIPLSIHNNQLKRSILEKGDVLYSIAGTIGRVIIIEDNILPSNTNQALAILRPKGELCPTGYLSLILKDDYFQTELHSNIVQGVQANLSLSMISAQKFVFPPAEKIGQIFSLINNLLMMQGTNYIENQTLAELRDTLLPKLMSGEIRIADAEREVEAH